MKHSPGFLALVQDAKKHVRETTVADVKARIDQRERRQPSEASLPPREQCADRKDALTLVDVREDHEWNEGRIPGAVHLGRGILERDAEEKFPDKNAEIVLYCGGGFRSALAADNLQKMGFTKVLSMDGGFRGWREAGHPTVK